MIMNIRALSVVQWNGEAERISAFPLTVEDFKKRWNRLNSYWFLKTTEANQDYTKMGLQNSSFSIQLSTLRQQSNRLLFIRSFRRMTAISVLIVLELSPFGCLHVRVFRANSFLLFFEATSSFWYTLPFAHNTGSQLYKSHLVFWPDAYHIGIWLDQCYIQSALL